MEQKIAIQVSNQCSELARERKLFKLFLLSSRL